MTAVPDLRVRRLNEAGSRADGAYVLYWMTAQRRLGWNYALDHTLDVARRLGKPVLVFEAIESDYRWASPRNHNPILIGMREHEAALAATEGWWAWEK